MKRRIVWLVVSCLVAVALVVTSCGPAEEEDVVVEEEEEEEEVVAEGPVMLEWHLTKLDGTPVVALVEKPQYGGILSHAWESEPTVGQDPCITSAWLADHVYDRPIMFDWARGPAGTNENPYALPDCSIEFGYGVLCDSWNIPDPLTYEFHIQPGVTWQNKHPTWGREFTAEDMAYHWNRLHECRWPRHDFVDLPSSTPFDSDGDGIDDSVRIKSNRPVANWFYEFAHVWYNQVLPVETVEAGVGDWKNISGTGPFWWAEYIPGTLARFERNMDYFDTWEIDDEEFQLPFIDELDIIVIPQLAGRLAALRTGKIEIMGGVAPIYWPELKAEGLNEASYMSYGSTMFFACDTPPLDDLDVRRALNMACDRQGIIDNYFLGAAEIISFPMSTALPDLYIPMEELPVSVQEYYEYNPVEAERLLDLAGKPRDPVTGERFELTIIVPAAAQTTHEMAEIVASYFEEVGVKLTLEPLESAALTPRVFDGPYDICFDWWANPRFTALNDFKMGNQWNRSNLTDVTFNELWDDALTATNTADFIANIKIAIVHWMELAPGFMGPGPYRKWFWQPWLKGFGGEVYLAYNNSSRIWAYTWIDQDLKEEMTGSR